MTTFYDFRCEKDPALHAFTNDRSAAKLPEADGPWTLVRQVEGDAIWHYPTSRAAVSAGVAENGFFLWEAASAPASAKPVIESDRVEGTAVYDRSSKRIGTVERVMIDKISGRVAYAVMSFGGFFGLGADEYAVPWSMLDYDPGLGGYRIQITAEQLRSAPSLSRARGQDWPDRQSEQNLHDYYQVSYYWVLA